MRRERRHHCLMQSSSARSRRAYSTHCAARIRGRRARGREGRIRHRPRPMRDRRIHSDERDVTRIRSCSMHRCMMQPSRTHSHHAYSARLAACIRWRRACGRYGRLRHRLSPMRARRIHYDERDETSVRCSHRARTATRPRRAVSCVHTMATHTRSRRAATPPPDTDARPTHPQR